MSDFASQHMRINTNSLQITIYNRKDREMTVGKQREEKTENQP